MDKSTSGNTATNRHHLRNSKGDTMNVYTQINNLIRHLADERCGKYAVGTSGWRIARNFWLREFRRRSRIHSY